VNWDKFEDDKSVLEYLSELPRYYNKPLKSLYRRGLFFLSLIYCRTFNINKPLFIVLVTNNLCDFKCTYCYGDYGNRKGIQDFTTKELLKIIDELKAMGTRILTLHGGESLLRKDFGEILNYAKLKGFYVSLNSNGTLVPKRIDELKCLDNLCISLDGREESNDKNRGKGSFKKALTALETAKENNIPIVVSATLTKDNVKDMDYLAKLGKEKGFRIQYSILYNDSKLSNDLIMSNNEMREITRKIYDLKKQGYPIYYADNVLKSALQWPDSCDTRFFTKKDSDFTKNLKLVPCYHGQLKYQIDADGRVVVCWAHNYQNAPNIRTLGLKKAFKQCNANKDCEYCCFLANNEHNSVMHMSPKNIMGMMVLHIIDALKIKR